MSRIVQRVAQAAALAAVVLLAGCSVSVNTGGTAIASSSPVASGAPSDAASEPAASPSGTTISVFELEVDDCWRGATTDVLEVELVDCEEPHPYQVYVVREYDADEDTFPGQTALQTAADDACREAFSEYVGVEYDASEFFYHQMVPSESTWAEGDRELVCSLALPQAADWTGSGRDTGR